MTIAATAELAPIRPYASLLGRRVATALIAFWLLWFAVYTIFAIISDPEDWWKLEWARALVSAIGAALSFGLAAAIGLMARRSLAKRAFIAFIIALLATAMHSYLSQEIWSVVRPRPPGPFLAYYMTDFIMRMWFFVACAAIVVALSYAAEVRDREQRILALQRLAQSAQLRALRNQLDPHSLFNALNAIAGLISARRNPEAEAMTEGLSEFLRVTLTLDPLKLITLKEELELQHAYLAIQKARFEDRLKVEVEVQNGLENALLPSLITQPLIENSIKYAVAQSTDPVTLRIVAKAAGDRLVLTIGDDGGNAGPPTAPGSRLGLLNVAERLAAHFGDRASIESGPLGPGGYVNRITLPLEFAR